MLHAYEHKRRPLNRCEAPQGVQRRLCWICQVRTGGHGGGAAQRRARRHAATASGGDSRPRKKPRDHDPVADDAGVEGVLGPAGGGERLRQNLRFKPVIWMVVKPRGSIQRTGQISKHSGEIFARAWRARSAGIVFSPFSPTHP